jgi:hypothetical protein
LKWKTGNITSDIHPGITLPFNAYAEYVENKQFVMRQNYIKLARQAYWESLDKKTEKDYANAINAVDKNYFSQESS